MILLIDNFDSFTYNLAQLLGELGQKVKVYRNNAITVRQAEALKPDYLIISPGPGTPEQAGRSVELIRHFAGRLPVLGVCLGHQAVGVAFGARIMRAQTLMHGKSSSILHDSKTLFSGLPPGFPATRYHSLSVERATLPECLEVSAWTADGEIMALRHREYEVEGVQFHPESVATKLGKRIMENFLNRTQSGSAVDLKTVTGKIVEGQDLSGREMRETMRLIMEGEATPAQIASFITALRIKGETVEEISAAATVMREKATRVPVPQGRTVVDTCGTGGDGAHTFNISTVASLVAAGAGICVAKHGNRSVSSRCGSADLLKTLGVKIDLDERQMAASIRETGIGFLFAPTLHRAMRHVIGPRREIGIRTIFNILGPLSNPAFAHAQLLGVYDQDLVPVMAQVLRQVGIKRALVVHGSDGLDEITLTGITHAAELQGGELRERRIDPQDLGLRYCTKEDLEGGDPEENAQIALDILAGKERGPRRQVVLLNAGAAIYVGGAARDLAEGIRLAEESLNSGAALEKLKALKAYSNSNQPAQIDPNPQAQTNSNRQTHSYA